MPAPAPTLSVAPIAAPISTAVNTTTPTTATKPVIPTVSPTVVTDANIRENTIPNVQSTGNQMTSPASLTPAQQAANAAMTKSGSYQFGNGTGFTKGVNGTASTPITGTNGSSTTGSTTSTTANPDTDYESIYNKILGIENAQPVDPLTEQTIDLIASAKSSTDAAYNAQINGIQNQYSQLIQNQSAANSNEEQGEQNFLLKSGAYRTSTAPIAFHALVTGDINKLADLTSKENTSVANIQSAMAKDDYQSAQEEISALEKVQSDRATLADKVATTMQTANQKLQDQITQSKIDSSIADTFTSGITDPAKILESLKDKGVPVTMDQINKVLTDISAQSNKDISELTGETKNFYELQKMGTLPSSITSLPKDQQLPAFLNLTSKVSKATKPLYTAKDGTAITQSDISGGVSKLDASKVGGYADPTVYKAMYDQWEEAGLDPQDFIKNYPPKYYIDPSNTTLPEYLRPTSSNTVSNPFSSGTSS